jgi:peptidoglycan/LPS O-acetylase OafA/YrhL
MSKQNTYFSGLNGLRFLAAFLVLITHSESIRAKLGFFNISSWSLSQNGGLAVQFFFVLSGFLISYLLFQEQKNNETISIKQFYWRRILRIWPLYYLIAIVGLYLLPYVILPLIKQPFQAEYDLLTGSALFLFFLPNLANSWYETRHLHSLWSIGVEEQFYLFWAPLVKYFRKYFIAICLTIIILKITFFYYFYWKNPSDWLTLFISSLQFECMAIGGLGAYWLFHGGTTENNFWFSKPIQILVFLLLGGLIFANLELNNPTTWWGQIWRFLFHSPIYNVLSNFLFVYTIINISKNPLRLINTENRIFNFLGEISYGLYMYHPLVVHIVIKAFAKKLLFLPSWGFLIAMYILTLSVLIGVSYCSFRFFEKPIIKRWKTK